ncbi:unnamed protein product [Prorocentrum cordatum]|uniref:Uncharacterized protein n=1 Tax=Prorocentrum cordatum TaxID=2364126 RepID=A0ABN9S8S6_9DINO|nr:unnamed protein product [Polarella glacialis]
MAVCLCTCVKTACFPTDEKPFFEAAADGPARKMTRLRLRARLRAPRRVEARAPDPPLPPGRGQVGQTAKVSGEGEADEQPSSGISGQTHEPLCLRCWAAALHLHIEDWDNHAFLSFRPDRAEVERLRHFTIAEHLHEQVILLRALPISQRSDLSILTD